ncbi:MAG: DUF4388 domain-containing protein [Acidobacteriota bacterium]|nr:DUF4388 domain-containing protein [Acidobacteriota bacterium]
MGINGNISTMSLAEVFQWLQTGQKTGTLHLDGANAVKKEVYFQDGVIISATSNDPREFIGQFMLYTKRITEQQLTEALENQKRDHVLLGKILLQKGLLGKDELAKVLHSIVEEIIYDLFLWKEGHFEFEDDQLPQREMPSLQLDITHIVLEGATREDEWSRINQVFPNELIVVRPNIEKIYQSLPLDRGVARLLLLINGTRSLYELTRLYKATRYQVFKAMLDLHEAGLIEVGDYRPQYIQTTVAGNRDALKDMLLDVESLMNEGKLADAEAGITKLEEIAADSPDVRKLKEQIKEKRLETTARELVNPNAIPCLNMPMEKLTKMELSPEQGFLVSRINGVWDVKSIVKISPFGENVCLKIIKKFLDDGVIILK